MLLVPTCTIALTASQNSTWYSLPVCGICSKRCQVTVKVCQALCGGRHRWDAAAKELVCDELGVAYPVIGGMPNLRPADGRVIEVGDKDADPLAQPWGDDADAAGTGQSQPLQAGSAKPSGT